MSLAKELLEHFEPEIENLVLIPSDSGRYEITINGKLIYSKLQTGRHIDAGEVKGLIENILKNRSTL